MHVLLWTFSAYCLMWTVRYLGSHTIGWIIAFLTLAGGLTLTFMRSRFDVKTRMVVKYSFWIFSLIACLLANSFLLSINYGILLAIQALNERSMIQTAWSKQ